MTPLLLASERGSCTAVEILLSRGADPDLSGPSGVVPLHFASRRPDGELIVRSLLCRSAVYEARSVDGETPLDWAHDPSDCLLRTVDKIFRWLGRGRGFENRLILRLKALTDFDDQKAVAKARDRNGRTLVMVATRSGFAKIDALKLAVADRYVVLDVLKAALLFENDREAVLKASERLLEEVLELLSQEDPIVQEIRLVICVTQILVGNVKEASRLKVLAEGTWNRTVGSKYTFHKLHTHEFLTSKWAGEVLKMIEGKFCWRKDPRVLFFITKALQKTSKGSSGNLEMAESIIENEYDKKSLLDAFMFRKIGKEFEGRPEEALVFMSKSYEIFKSILRDDGHEVVLQSLYLVAKAHSLVKDFEQARICFEKLLKILKGKGETAMNDPFTNIVQQELGSTLFQLKKPVGSLLILKEVVNRGNNNDRAVKVALIYIESIKKVLMEEKCIPEWFLQDIDDFFRNG